MDMTALIAEQLMSLSAFMNEAADPREARDLCDRTQALYRAAIDEETAHYHGRGRHPWADAERALHGTPAHIAYQDVVNQCTDMSGHPAPQHHTLTDPTDPAG